MKQVEARQLLKIGRLLLVAVLISFLGLFSSEAALPKAPTTGVVVDQVNLLSRDTVMKLNSIDRKLQEGSGAEIGVLLISSLDGADISEYANEVHRAWGVGKQGKDNGLLIVMSIEDKKIYVSVGYGLEGVLNDAKVGQIIDEVAIPKFKQGRYEEGILHLYLTLANIVARGESGNPPQEAPEMTWQDILIFGGVIILIIIDIIFFGGRVTITAIQIFGRSRGGGGGGYGGGGRGGFGGGSSGGGGAGRGW